MHNITMTTKTTAFIAGALLTLGTALPALALDVSTQASVDVGAGGTATMKAKAGARMGSTTAEARKDAALASRIEKAKARANEEITRRVAALNGLGGKIEDMKRVMADQKTAFAATIQTQVSALASLQAKIAADTDIDSLKADIKSITDSYRIFMVVLPQVRLNAAADKIQTTATAMATLSAKLSTRITDAQAKGKNVATLSASLTDMNAKIADANTQAAAVISITASLKPDNGDATVAASNKAALKDARAKLKTAEDDLKAARKDAGSIVKALKEMHIDVTATTSASVSTQ